MDTFKQALKCELTQSEIAAMKDRMALLYGEWQAAEAKRKVEAKKLKDDADLLAKELAAVNRDIRNGWVFRDIECREIRDDVGCRIDLMRTDTGEIVSSRPMQPHERQRALFALNSNAVDG
jgi:hypothetical protein